MFGLGAQELLLILVIILVLFGAKRIPEMARGLGKSITEFKKGVKEVDSEIRDATNTDTPESDSTPQPTSTTAEPTRSANNDKPSSTPPTPQHRTDSDTHLAPHASLRQHGSTNHRRHPWPPPPTEHPVSHQR